MEERGVAGAGSALVVAPEQRAAEAAAAVLAEGGHAVAAMVCAAATIAVTYPHMCGLGGDGFWLVLEPGVPAWGIDAAGVAGTASTPGFYAERGWRRIPIRGPLAANTVAGAVSGWSLALQRSQGWDGVMPLSRLLEPAIRYARDASIAPGLLRSLQGVGPELIEQLGFREHFMPHGVPGAQTRLCQNALAETLTQLGRAGLEDFYEGDVARMLATELQQVGSPLSLVDLTNYKAQFCQPWTLEHRLGVLYNLPPPTQGVVSLAILGIVDRLAFGGRSLESADGVHAVVEATKQAFRLRDEGLRHGFTQHILTPERLNAAAGSILQNRAAPWGPGAGPGDTVWMGIIDRAGRAVSYIQSLYHEFGSGLALPGSGVLWQNRGSSFSLREGHHLSLVPGRKPWHTLNPAMALLKDGSCLVYGAMGGDGQGQTQAAIFIRSVLHGHSAQDAVAAPRWLLGRTWGQPTDTLKVEDRFSAAVIEQLRTRGHVLELLSPFDEAVGHAGLVRRDRDGILTGASDPRSDGAAIVVAPVR